MEEIESWEDLDYWIAKDGSHIYPEQMTNEHLNNTIQYLVSRYGTVESDIEFHGEVIQHRAIGAIYNTRIFQLLVAEQEKRQAAITVQKAVKWHATLKSWYVTDGDTAVRVIANTSDQAVAYAKKKLKRNILSVENVRPAMMNEPLGRIVDDTTE